MAREKKIDMVILGLLSHEDLTGYDIKKRIDKAVSFFWKGSFGNIYPTLKEMETKGLITKKDTYVGGREKITYHIEKQGRLQLVKWLSDEQAGNELRYETLLKLFFGGSVDKSVSVKNIEAFENHIRGELAILKGYAKTLGSNQEEDDHLYYYLTVSFGIDSYEAYLKWCESAKKMLKKAAKGADRA